MGELRELVMDREAWRAAIHSGHKESDMTERLNWTELNQFWKWKFHFTPLHFTNSHTRKHEVINSWKQSNSVVYLPRSLTGSCYHWQQRWCRKATVKSGIHTIWNCLCQVFFQGENNIQQLSAYAYHICTHFGSIFFFKEKKLLERNKLPIQK